jgi:sec-independent protein translocase protein TatA
MRFGWVEILLVVVVVLLIFGGRRIPELMRGMGRGIREFKDGLHDTSGNDFVSGKKP